MPSRPRPLSQADRLAWAEYARLVRSLPGRQVDAPAPTPPPSANPALQPPVTKLPTRPSAPPLVTGQPPAGLDKASWGRLRGGKLTPTRTLDLHGRTVQAAFHALERFLQQAHADRQRCVEVITGRGSGEQGGAIRRELPLWLNLPTLRPLVLAASHPHAQNTGSVRLLLRRMR